MFMTRRPVPDRTLVDIVDDVFLPLVRSPHRADG
jgi:hypothetical protein